MPASIYPSLFQVNTRVWLTELSRKSGRTATLDDIPDSELDNFVSKGFDWIWFLSVWQTGKAGQQASRTNPEWLHEFRETLPDLKEEDIPGSGFAIIRYDVHEQLGGDAALARLRKRMQERGLKLMLDFVPNHSAIDHDWVQLNPDFYIRGNESNFASEPANYIKLMTQAGEIILAHGRDPYFPGWPDTLQYDYSNPKLQEALTNVLIKIASQCDGVRCDMAMLVLPEVFGKTWGVPCRAFWPEATKAVREHHPGFLFMAEVYWDMEWTLQQQGFDYTYDKRLYDRLKEGHAKPVREHFYAELGYQQKMSRFLENHDEPRVAAEFPDDKHKAAAILTFFSTGLRFFHQGQFQGKKKRISPHLGRGPEEPVNESLQKFYDQLLSVLHQPVFRSGNWQLLEAKPVSDGNWSNGNYISFGWEASSDKKQVIVVVNYAPASSQCFLRIPFEGLAKKQWRLRDLFSDISYERDGNDLNTNGLFLDEPAWKYYIFQLEQR